MGEFFSVFYFDECASKPVSIPIMNIAFFGNWLFSTILNSTANLSYLLANDISNS